MNFTNDQELEKYWKFKFEEFLEIQEKKRQVRLEGHKNKLKFISNEGPKISRAKI